MTRKDVIEAFFFDHLERFHQAVHKRQRRGVGEVTGRVGRHHVAEVEIRAFHLRALTHRECFLASAQNAQASWQHQTLLRARHSHVNAPVIETEIDRAERRYAIHKQQRRMLSLVECFAYTCDVRGHASGGFIVAGQNCFDLVAGISFKNVSVLLQRHARAPLAINDLHVEAEAGTHINPQMTELTEASSQHAVARRQGVGDCSFPAASAGRRENERRAVFGTEHFFQPRHHLVRQCRKLRRAVVFH